MRESNFFLLLILLLLVGAAAAWGQAPPHLPPPMPPVPPQGQPGKPVPLGGGQPPTLGGGITGQSGVAEEGERLSVNGLSRKLRGTWVKVYLEGGHILEGELIISDEEQGVLVLLKRVKVILVPGPLIADITFKKKPIHILMSSIVACE